MLVYNPSKISEAELPKSIMDLQDPKWKGKWGAAAGGADFQAIVSAILATQGEDKTAAWLKGLKDGAQVYQNNIAVMKAVNAGQVPVGIMYHYYWYRDQALTKAGSGNTKLLYFRNQDPGAFVSLSGGASSSRASTRANAQKFLAFVTSKEGQDMLATSDAKEYAVGNGVASDTGPRAARLPRGARRRPVHAQRSQGHRADDERPASSRWPARPRGAPAPPRQQSSRPAWSWRPCACCRWSSSPSRPSTSAGRRPGTCCGGRGSASCCATPAPWSP